MKISASTTIRINNKKISIELVDAPDDEFGRMLRPHGGRKAVIFGGVEIGHVQPYGPEERRAHAMAGVLCAWPAEGWCVFRHGWYRCSVVRIQRAAMSPRRVSRQPAGDDVARALQALVSGGLVTLPDGRFGVELLNIDEIAATRDTHTQCQPEKTCSTKCSSR
jgi:hypothetical protein